MSDIIKQLEHVLSVVENDIEYYDKKLKINPKLSPELYEIGFYRGGKAALTDMKNYLEKEIKRNKITNKFDKDEKVS